MLGYGGVIYEISDDVTTNPQKRDSDVVLMHIFLDIIVIFLSITVMACDLYARRVPNTWLIAALTLGFAIIIATWMRDPTIQKIWPPFVGLLIGLVALLPFHIFGWMGAGDVKFFATLGFLLGMKALLPIWIIASLIAGVHATGILLSRHWLSHAVPAWPLTQAWVSKSSLGRRIDRARQGRQGLPYAAWLGVGALITVFNPELVHW